MYGTPSICLGNKLNVWYTSHLSGKILVWPNFGQWPESLQPITLLNFQNAITYKPLTKRRINRKDFGVN